MVRLLIRYVLHKCRSGRWFHRESRIALLPGKPEFWMDLADQMTAAALGTLDYVRQRHGRWQSEQQVHMVCDTNDGLKPSIGGNYTSPNGRPDLRTVAMMVGARSLVAQMTWKYK